MWEKAGPTLKRSLSLILADTAASPEAIAYPTTQGQLADLLTCAHQQGWRLLPCGSGSKLDWGGLTTGVDLVVSTERLTQLIEHAAGDLTVTAEAGLRLAQLQQQLSLAHQFVALDPAWPQQATLGGLVASANAGSLRQRYGGLRDMLIGLSFVRVDGQLAKAGGRVVKNVAGYDLMKLLSGSYGSLGVICQVTLRTYPLPEASQSLVFSGTAAAVQQLSQAVRRSPLTPVALDLLSPALMAAAGLGSDFGLAARFQSVALGVDEQCQRLLSLAEQPGLSGSLLSGDQETQFWAQSSAQLFSPQPPETAAIAKVGVLPAQAAALLSQVEALGGFGRIHAGSGVGHLQLHEPTPAALLGLRTQAQQSQGYLSLLVAPPSLKQAVDVWGYSGSALPLMRQLKQQFDPQQQLSPGRFVGGL